MVAEPPTSGAEGQRYVDPSRAGATFGTGVQSGFSSQQGTSGLREAETVQCPPIPTVNGVNRWMTQVKEAVAAASASSEFIEVYRWIGAADQQLANPEVDLGYDRCPMKFRTLDSKVATKPLDKIGGDRVALSD